MSSQSLKLLSLGDGREGAFLCHFFTFENTWITLLLKVKTKILGFSLVTLDTLLGFSE